MRDFQLPGRSAVFATNGICATSHPLAAQDGDRRASRPAATPWTPPSRAPCLLGFCEPQMTGIGGDCFVLVKPAGEERIIALNGSGRAPAGLSPPRCGPAT